MKNKPRKWWIAGFLSLIDPGLGQIYNGQIQKGILFLVAPLLLFPLMILCMKTDSILFFMALFAFLLIAYYLTAICDAIYTGFKFRTSYTLKTYNNIIVYILIMVVVYAMNMASAIYVRNNYVQAFKIAAASNRPTLRIGDQILVDRSLSARNPERGEFIVFEFPEDPKRDFVKRVVAIGGDTVEIRDKILMINNSVAEEGYVIHSDSGILSASCMPRDNFGPVTVPENSFFVMGDNRDSSYDSRFWGFVKKSKIRGTVTHIYWSWNKESSSVRWDRIGIKVE